MTLKRRMDLARLIMAQHPDWSTRRLAAHPLLAQARISRDWLTKLRGRPAGPVQGRDGKLYHFEAKGATDVREV